MYGFKTKVAFGMGTIIFGVFMWRRYPSYFNCKYINGSNKKQDDE